MRRKEERRSEQSVAPALRRCTHVRVPSVETAVHRLFDRSHFSQRKAGSEKTNMVFHV